MVTKRTGTRLPTLCFGQTVLRCANAWVARLISPRPGLSLFSLLISSKPVIYSRHQHRFYPPPTLSPTVQLPFKSIKNTSPHSIQPSLMRADTPQNKFERNHDATICDFDFQRGALVLIRNTAIEKALNQKMRARYLGPLVVLSCNTGGTYILCELDGSVLDRPIAAFCVIPYLARTEIPLPPFADLIDITTNRLCKLKPPLSTT
jgi:hypothetical protein